MLALKRSPVLVLLLTLAACVTVNIYFPAAAAEKAADQFIQDVWQKTPDSKTSESPAPAQDAAQQPDLSLHAADPRRWLVALISAASGTAYAQTADYNASSAETERLKAGIAARFPKLKIFFDSGAVGLTHDGYVAVHDAGAAAMNQRGVMQQLVKAENRDRKQLYQAVAKANSRPDWFDDIREAYAKRWIAQADAGWWYQTRDGKWVQK